MSVSGGKKEGGERERERGEREKVDGAIRSCSPLAHHALAHVGSASELQCE